VIDKYGTPLLYLIRFGRVFFSVFSGAIFEFAERVQQYKKTERNGHFSIR
jgi:hypothetical protein